MKTIPQKEELENQKHLSLRELSIQYKVSTQTVARWYRFYGIEKLTKPSKEELSKYTHLTQKEVAQIFHRTKQAISLWGLEYGLVFCQKRPWKNLPSKEE